ncbi:hypothetical protein AB1Y20_014794 [Prymnesium parvum]|uniref:Protein kinase domain-containing protein n=1 Tax=Prymnesium parvum TaxID=97485 RepID=A0AB34ICG2_PRYPA
MASERTSAASLDAASFSKKLKENVESQQTRRRSSLEALSIITNSTEYRHAVEKSSSPLLCRLSHMLEQGALFSEDELTHVRRLGEGGFAFVELYERDCGGGHKIEYAVKVMKDKKILPAATPYGEPRIVSVGAHERTQFLTEAVFLRSLRHKHVVGCFGCLREAEPVEGAPPPPPKLLMEYCPDGTLLGQLRRPRYSAAEAVRWLHGVALGMEYLHSSGGIHRDLKPENVLLKDGVAKVADFGLFRMERSLGSSNPQAPADDSSIKPNGSPELMRSFSGVPLCAKYPSMSHLLQPAEKEATRMTGTARYMAPELHVLHEREDFTNKVDVFSFGILAYELLSRKRAYAELEHLTMDQVAEAVHRRCLRPALPKAWAPAVRRLIQRAWAQQPEDRPSFTELAATISALQMEGENAPEGLARHFGLLEAGGVGSGSCACAIL